MQGSWRPTMDSFSSVPRLRDTLSCSRAMDGVGLKAARKMRGIPLVMPPRMPPAWLLLAVTRPSFMAKGSLCSEPRIRAARKPAPNSRPFTAGTPNMA